MRDTLQLIGCQYDMIRNGLRIRTARIGLERNTSSAISRTSNSAKKIFLTKDPTRARGVRYNITLQYPVKTNRDCRCNLLEILRLHQRPEGVGFEPTVTSLPRSISSRVPSTGLSHPSLANSGIAIPAVSNLGTMCMLP